MADSLLCLVTLPALAQQSSVEPTVLYPGENRLTVTSQAGIQFVVTGLVLLLAFRDRRRALIPLIPIALATGWSALLLFALRVPLNPMSATLGALVIAIATEFSVLLSARYEEERAARHSIGESLRSLR